ncbi:MAG TPA: outer membrane beta-barrel protein [Pyrinomonadaceae bacterium]|nr:outer membrane beta-barrel protein [Pyrinomonadaceae bacterium]
MSRPRGINNSNTGGGAADESSAQPFLKLYQEIASMKKITFVIASAIMFALAVGQRDALAQKEDAPKVEVGAFFTSLSYNAADFGRAETRPGIGGRVTYNLTDNVALEAETSLIAGRTNFFGPNSDTWQGQFGVKAGKRFEKFGIFGKARPGFVSFGRVPQVTGFQTQTTPEGQFIFPILNFERKTYFSTDIGGVLEFYPTRRIVTRFDIGDTIILYRDRTGVAFGPPSTTFRLPNVTTHNLQFSAGVGFRF